MTRDTAAHKETTVPAEDSDRRERPDDPRQGFRVRFEQPFLHGPGRQHEAALACYGEGWRLHEPD
jgi:hypothetical protein